PANMNLRVQPLNQLPRAALDDALKEMREAQAEMTRNRAQAKGARAEDGIVAKVQEKLRRGELAIEAEIARREGRPPPPGAEGLTAEEKEHLYGGPDDMINGVEETMASVADRAEQGAKPSGLKAKLIQKLKNPELLLYKIEQSAYKFSFLL